MSRVLITGGGGFLGQKLAQALAKAGTIRGNAISDLVLEGRTANCPVSGAYAVWHSAPRTIIANLCHAAEVDGTAFGYNRNINLPGRSDTIDAMIDAMRKAAGEDPVSRITWARDPVVEKIALGWRGNVAHEKALKLGFKADRTFEDSIKWFLKTTLIPAEIYFLAI